MTTPINQDRQCDKWRCKEIATYGTKCAKHANKCNVCKTRTATRYCTEHECSVVNCENERKRGLVLCGEHACYTCGEICLPNGRYCKTHSCRKSGCVKEHTNGSQYCQEHARELKCYVSGCAGEEYTDDEGTASKYCIEHKCSSCLERKMEGGMYCEPHTCSIGNCFGPHVESSQYCSSHKCTVCEEKHVEDGINCPEHTCIETNCTGPLVGANYCKSHKCKTCDEKSLSDGDFCLSHSCHISGSAKRNVPCLCSRCSWNHSSYASPSRLPNLIFEVHFA